MITLQEIKGKIESSERPLAFFDDDPDGLSSFLQLKIEYPKIEGMAVKGTPILTKEKFFTKVENYCPDLIIVLDKSEISEEFRQSANVPIIWIDHHSIADHKGTKYFNPNIEKKYKYAPPVAYWIYKMLKKNTWIAAAGTIGDYYPFKSKKFKEKYHHLLPEEPYEIEDILYNSKFGEIIQIFDFVLKGKTQDMKNSIKTLSQIKEPEEILNQSTLEGKYIYERYNSIKRYYDDLLKRALEHETPQEPFVFLYEDQKYSFSAPISTHINHLIKNEFMIIGRNKTHDGVAKLSIRSKTKDLRPIIKKVLKDINGHGGGHKNACGAQVPLPYLNDFIENFKEAITTS